MQGTFQTVCTVGSLGQVSRLFPSRKQLSWKTSANGSDPVNEGQIVTYLKIDFGKRVSVHIYRDISVLQVEDEV